MVSRAGLVTNEPVAHGGDLGAARRRFPNAPEPFIDLSTGINPVPYPLPQLPHAAFARLPEPAALERLADIAARAYGAPSAAHVVPGPGTQLLLPLVAGLGAQGRAAILGPTYGEHARAASLAGHDVREVATLQQLGGADLVIVTNPNNPDGRVVGKHDLLAVADDLRGRNGLLLVDEAFMDVGPQDAGIAAEVGRGNIVVLRSFGKFYGLAGLRLGFALAAPELAEPIRALLGPWATSGPAVAIGEIALADTAWADAARLSLFKSAERLDALLTNAQLAIVGGTSLFRLARTEDASELFDRLGRAGVLVRRFADHPTWLRFGLPGSERDWQRLSDALTTASGYGQQTRKVHSGG
jgi:cobalamin biosynthetic protein CobC